MSGQGDERAERILAQAVAGGPRDILGLLRALRRDMADHLGRREGFVHALVHRMVKDGRLVAGGQSAAGLVLYRGEDAPEPPAAAVDASEASVDAATAQRALRVSRAVKDPADRGRVLADVRAHLAELADVHAPTRFGRPKAVATLMQRVDRGKATVILPISWEDSLRRFALHEGVWILGAIVVFFVLKTFVVAPFKIPSGSMEPTLHGEQSLWGDRVAVFTAFHDGVPDRYDVIVYERSGVNYVKRLVGLPGEDVALWLGDVYIDGKLLQRPAWLVEALRSRVDSWRLGDVAPSGFASQDNGAMRRWWWRSGRFTAHPQGDVSFGMHDGFATLEGTRAPGQTIELILAHGPGGTRVESLGWVLRVDDGGITLLERKGLDLTRGTTAPEQMLDTAVGAPTGSVRLQLAYVDGVLTARCGDASFEHARESDVGHLSVGAAQTSGATSMLTLTVDRDHHYSTPRDATHGTPVGGTRRAHRVPEGHVYCLGDNTTNSRDSRFSPVGDIPVDAIVGPVSVRIWPPNRWGLVR